MLPKNVLWAGLIACLLSITMFAQGPPPQQSYPPPAQNYPPPAQNYPPPAQNYPPPQGYPQPGYPPGQGYPSAYPPPAQQAPLMTPPQLDQLVERIALYPDPLIGNVLAASTYWNQIADAAAWANQHSYLRGDELSRAMYEDNLPFDPSVMALLPFPQVLDMMARDPGWTQALGNAVLTQRPDVMDAIQRMRQKAMDYGYLQSNAQYRVVVNGPGDIEILPVNPAYVYVPYYNPAVVFVAPRPGFFLGAGITFGPGVFVGAFAPFGWSSIAIGWRSHDILIDHRPWARTWANRGTYVHPYAIPPMRPGAARVERHDARRGEEHRYVEHHEHR